MTIFKLKDLVKPQFKQRYLLDRDWAMLVMSFSNAYISMMLLLDKKMQSHVLPKVVLGPTCTDRVRSTSRGPGRRVRRGLIYVRLVDPGGSCGPWSRANSSRKRALQLPWSDSGQGTTLCASSQKRACAMPSPSQGCCAHPTR